MKPPSVTIFDYGAGNLHSLAKALGAAGAIVGIEADPLQAIRATDALVLPGVGAFGAAAERLAPGRRAMRQALADGLPCLGICLGMQLLFDGSDEGEGRGLGVVAGRVTRLRADRVPQIGWNAVEWIADAPFAGAQPGIAYYANSFVCRPDAPGSTIAWSTHEDDRFAAAVHTSRTTGVQFHPEKSSRDGVNLLRAFVAGIGR